MSYGFIEGQPGPWRICEWTFVPPPDEHGVIDAADLMWCSRISVGLGPDGRAYCGEHLPKD